MLETLSLQRNSYLAEGEVSAATRIDRLQRTIEVLVNNAEKISEAMNADFGCRPRQVNLMTDVTGSLENLKHAKKHLTKWMKSEKRPSMFPSGLARRPLVYSVPTQGRRGCDRALELSPWAWCSSPLPVYWRRATAR
jgi:acyl-CoA reductase-like NAD-dependent aldehyde dehydrogenase